MATLVSLEMHKNAAAAFDDNDGRNKAGIVACMIQCTPLVQQCMSDEPRITFTRTGRRRGDSEG